MMQSRLIKLSTDELQRSFSVYATRWFGYALSGDLHFNGKAYLFFHDHSLFRRCDKCALKSDNSSVRA